MGNLLGAILFLLVLTSCGGGSPPSVETAYPPKKSDCATIQFENGFLKKENFLALAECLDWDEKYSDVITAIELIPGPSWSFFGGCGALVA